MGKLWVECLAPVDLWEVDLKDELYLGFKMDHTQTDRHTDTQTDIPITGTAAPEGRLFKNNYSSIWPDS